WFGRAFGAEQVERFDRRDENDHLHSAILVFPGIPSPVELRRAPETAEAALGYDPVSFGVGDEEALDGWIVRLDKAGIAHTGKVSAVNGKVIGVTSPDGMVIRIYTDPEGGFGSARTTGN